MSAVPKLRFPEFTVPLTKKNLGKLFSKRTNKGNENLPVYSVTMNRGLVRRDSISRDVGDDAKPEQNFFVAKGDLAYNTMRMWQGAVGLAVEDGMVSPAYVVLTPNEQTNSTLFLHWFKDARMIYRLWAYSYGLTSDRLRLYYDDFAKISVWLPSLPEQQKIASFLSAVDKKIDLLRQKKEVLEIYKKGLMQKIFSQEIRFKQEDGSDFPDWEEVALEDVIKEIGDGGTPDTKNPDYFGGKIPWVVIEDISEKIVKTKTTITELGLRKSSAKIWPKGSLILSTGATIGRVGIAETDVTTKQGICGIILNEGVNYKFIFYVLTWSSPWFLRMAQGNTIKEVRASTVKKMTFGLPSGGEQQKVASFLSAIDTKIQNTSSQIENMETFKKGLLQQMFV